jgi:hypothetical protein
MRAGNANAYSNSYSDRYCNTDSDTYGNRYRFAYANTECNTDSDTYGNRYRFAYGNAKGNAQASADSASSAVTVEIVKKVKKSYKVKELSGNSQRVTSRVLQSSRRQVSLALPGFARSAVGLRCVPAPLSGRSAIRKKRRGHAAALPKLQRN